VGPLEENVTQLALEEEIITPSNKSCDCVAQFGIKVSTFIFGIVNVLDQFILAFCVKVAVMNVHGIVVITSSNSLGSFCSKLFMVADGFPALESSLGSIHPNVLPV
jgi:hypothetical protein